MRKLLSLRMILGLALGLGLAAPAFAGPDNIYPNSATWSVNAVADGNITNGFSAGSDGATTLNTDIYAGNAISVSVGWKIQDRSAQPGTDTNYPRTVTFTATTTQTPSGAVSIAAISNCTVESAASTCLTAIDFAAPSTVGSYQIKITPSTGTGAGGPLTTRFLVINFHVAENVAVDTKLTVNNHCFLLNAGVKPLTAKLEELDSGTAISGESIDFYINPPSTSIGSAVTDSNGVGTLQYNVNGLAAGDHNLYVEYAGNSSYNGSNSSATVGISYLFVGFGQPINADGTSIFGGRVIPIKIKLVDANGNPVTDAAPTVWLTSYSTNLGLGTELETVTSVSQADTGNIMRYVPDDKQYIYNWDATNLSNGTYAVVVKLGDSTTCRSENPYAIITVEKRGKK